MILQSTVVCPSCRKHLRFAGGAGGEGIVPAFTPLKVEGAIKHPLVGEAWEYAVVVSVTNDRGEEIVRQIVAVGAMQPGEQRKFSFAVEVFTPGGTPDAN